MKYDYNAWIMRAYSFTRSCELLPGRVESETQEIEHCTPGELDHLSSSLRVPIPKVICEFLMWGGINCAFRYSWHPPPP